MGLAIGEILQDRYRIDSVLGLGGMGTVYHAWNIRLNIPVAIKEMLPQPGLGSQALLQLRRQFQQEAQVLARLDHPRLVRVTDFFSRHDSEYLVMNFVAGENLADRIERNGKLSEPQVLTWANQLLDALAYCHNQGIIHRDVKPQNVIIRSDGQVVLVDFGLVKLWDPHDPHTRTAMRGMGTPQYAPPEQYQLEAGYTDVRSDIYSLGATLYHALTGQAPPPATQRMSDPEQFVPLRETAPKVSEQTDKAVTKAMELARTERWQSAEEMRQSLQTVDQSGHPLTMKLWRGQTVAISARRPSAQSRTAATGRQKRVPLWAGAVGGLAVILLVVGLVVGLGNGQDGTAPTPTSTRTTPVSTPLIFIEAATTTPLPVSTPVLMPSPTPTFAAPPQTANEQPTPTTNTPTATSRPTDTPSPTITAAETPTPTPTPTATFTPIPEPTATPSPTSTTTATLRPSTATPTPIIQATPPELIAPVQGGQYKNPISFLWQGSLNAGEAYQVTLYHPGSNYTIQSELLSTPQWVTDLPGDRYGEWQWTISVVKGGNVSATSAEWMFWFDPSPGGGGGAMPTGPAPTATSPPP